MIGIFLDTETNGLDSKKHKILEIAYKLIDLHDGKEIFTFHTLIKQSKEDFDKSNPSSLKINGFTFEETQKGLEKEMVKKMIISSFKKFDIVRKKAVFICQNPSFDRVFFASLIPVEEQEQMLLPYHWLDLASMYWAICLSKEKNYPWKTGLSKDQIAKSLGLDVEPSPHRAQNGVNHLIQCYESLLGFPS